MADINQEGDRNCETRGLLEPEFWTQGVENGKIRKVVFGEWDAQDEITEGLRKKGRAWEWGPLEETGERRD